jgi:hypothetical protein
MPEKKKKRKDFCVCLCVSVLCVSVQPDELSVFLLCSSPVVVVVALFPSVYYIECPVLCCDFGELEKLLIYSECLSVLRLLFSLVNDRSGLGPFFFFLYLSFFFP